jgi:periplasmic protein TonB
VKVMVSFVVSEDGSISDINVINKSEVDSHLANEAMRVIRESPVWESATIYGVKTKMPATQPVIFTLTK